MGAGQWWLAEPCLDPYPAIDDQVQSVGDQSKFIVVTIMPFADSNPSGLYPLSGCRLGCLMDRFADQMRKFNANPPGGLSSGFIAKILTERLSTYAEMSHCPGVRGHLALVRGIHRFGGGPS